MQRTRRHLFVTLLAAALPARALATTPPPAPATGPSPALLGVWRDALDPARYLVSEKYDGVRGVWDGATLRHRSGRTVSAPAWFTAQLPAMPLDGELWLGRGRFDELSALVRREVPLDAEWRHVRYMLFDLPAAPGGFAVRARRLAALVRPSGSPQLVVVDQAPLADHAALAQRLAWTTAQGGEGLVLHRADAAWQPGRNEAVLKLKPSLDAEAVVVGHRAGRGKYQGQLGALELRAADGRRLLVGSGLSDAQRGAPPPPGSIVTYRYRDLTRTGLPRFATFVRLHEAL